MAGYWRNPDASAEALRGGWLHTGDVGAFDADGYLTLVDRSKDLIISCGPNAPARIGGRLSGTGRHRGWRGGCRG